MAKLSLVLASGPGFPEGDADQRYELEVTLNDQRQLDAAAWAADTSPWAACRLRPGQPDLCGDIQHDPDTGWSLRFFPPDADPADAPLYGVLRPAGDIRPGEYVTIGEPGGAEFAYRIVNLD